MSVPGELVVGAYGAHALMVDLPGLDEVHALDAALRAAPLPGVTDVVPAARTVLVLLDDTATPADLVATEGAIRARWASRVPVASRQRGDVVEIPVVYDGQDLPDVAAWAGLSVAEVVARHSGREYVVAFGGFMPGFAYLDEVDPSIAAPRLSTPRTQVPAGSVALAGDLTAVYPRATPGGWRLLGRTDVELFDVDRDPPALLTAGTRVRFRAVERLGAGTGDDVDVVRSAGADRASGWGAVDGTGADEGQDAAQADGVEVIASGPLTVVEDRGRPGWAAAGVGRSGAADQAAFGLLNRLLANDEAAASLEVTLGGLVLRFHERATFALAGANVPVTLDGTAVGMLALLEARPGSEVRLGYASTGLRTYLGVRGGFVVRPVLGSRSFDVLAGLGPAPLRAGDRLVVGPRPGQLPVVDAAPPPVAAGGDVELTVLPGVRREWFDDGAWTSLLGGTFEVSDASNRVGLRLTGSLIGRRPGELPSEGLVPGAIQVPPDGRLVVFLRDHPVTGGYPTIGVVDPRGLDAAAQLRPGDTVRFRDRGGWPGRPSAAVRGGLREPS